MINKLGLTIIVLSALLLSGCGGNNSSSSQGGDSSSSSKNADIVIDNVSTHDIGKVFIKKSSVTTYGTSILTQTIKAGTEVALSTTICDTNIDINIISTDNLYTVDFKNLNLPCNGTLSLQVQ